MSRNAHGRIVGDDHHRVRIPDAVVHELRDLHEHRKLRYAQLVELFGKGECSSAPDGIKLTYGVVRAICGYHRRCSP